MSHNWKPGDRLRHSYTGGLTDAISKSPRFGFALFDAILREALLQGWPTRLNSCPTVWAASVKRRAPSFALLWHGSGLSALIGACQVTGHLCTHHYDKGVGSAVPGRPWTAGSRTAPVAESLRKEPTGPPHPLAPAGRDSLFSVTLVRAASSPAIWKVLIYKNTIPVLVSDLNFLR